MRRAGRRSVAAAAALLVAAGPGASAADAMPADLPITGGALPVPTAVEPVVAESTYGAPAPRIERVACRSGCGPTGAAAPGALVRVEGRRLQRVAEVVFLAGPGEGDDTAIAPSTTARRSVVARVPRTASSGRVAVALADGTRSVASPDPLVVDAGVPAAAAAAIDVEVQAPKVFFDAARTATLSYVIGGIEPAAVVVVDLVRAADDAVIASWTSENVAPGVPQTIAWDGTADGRVQKDGVYAFRARATSVSGAVLASAAEAPARLATERAAAPDPAAEAEPGAFTLLRNRFPIVGAHSFGTGGAAFGGGRGHQGQDVFAECGTPIVAARGGEVAFKQFEGRAGHYVVIDGAGTDVDYVYMHLRDEALVDVGDRVHTGEQIGYVGATGRADGCHLHFEMWNGRGWYDGGAAFDPLGPLEAWDAQS